MSDRKKAVLGMSGGVDSSTALSVLINNSYDVIGMTHIVQERAISDASEAAAICKSFGKEHITLDLREEFRREVIDYFVNEYRSGRTPNPCVKCNEKIKFPYLFREAGEDGIVATGHYARIGKYAGRHLLLRGKDPKKDQSYVLWKLTGDELSKIIFPLGEMSKEEVRQIALENGISSALKKESQDICFIPDGDYARFIKEYANISFNAGDYVSTEGNVLGKHAGHMKCTLGQSRGLGIALGRKMYVVSKNAETNTVVLGDKSDVMKKTVRANNINLTATDSIPDSSRFTVKIRYGKSDTPASVTQTGEDEITAVFDEAVFAPAPGQSMVIYDGDTVIGGGIII